MDQEYDYDYFVIGGGSGGLASAKEAVNHGARVAIADYVIPSPKGTKWGIGGTCVNVGCIPKKLMHFAAQVGELRHDQIECGWDIDNKSLHNWDTMVKNVQKHIKKLNWGYKVQLVEKNIKYYNKLAKVIDQHNIELNDFKRSPERVTAKYILVAVGGRPAYPSDVEGALEYCITSDDLFSLAKDPGKTLLVGASYIALECAGFLTGLGRHATVMVRSILLRGFDQEMANQIGKYMGKHGTRFLWSCLPNKIEKTNEGKLRVTYTEQENQTIKQEDFDTVVFAIGRTAETKKMGLDQLGVKLAQNGKVITGEDDRSSVNNIFAIGDCAEGRPELTPSAISAGKLLAKRLFGGSSLLMDYRNIATTVFTPLEYGCCGYSEEAAIEQFGEENIEVYQSIFKPLEWNFLPTHSDDCAVKIIVNKLEDEKVIGFHYLGPNAGEVTQGYSMALKMGVTKAQWDLTVKIHPTTAEELIGIENKKSENKEVQAGGC